MFLSYKEAKAKGLCVRCRKVEATLSSWCPPCKARRYEIQKKYRKSEHGRKKTQEHQNKHRQKRRLEVLQHYSGNPPHCQCPGCDVTEVKFLQFDHIAGGGKKHREMLGGRGGFRFTHWLYTQGFPEGIQVLCANCNKAKGFYGTCPHQT